MNTKMKVIVVGSLVYLNFLAFIIVHYGWKYVFIVMLAGVVAGIGPHLLFLGYAITHDKAYGIAAVLVTVTLAGVALGIIDQIRLIGFGTFVLC